MDRPGSPLIGVLDYKAGNLKSVETALQYLGASYRVVEEPEGIRDCDKILFPGVGEASSAVAYLKEKGFPEALKDFIAQGSPFLGICLGCQIILSHSEEGDTPCLGILEGEVLEFQRKEGYKVPHMGWNQIRILNSHSLLKGVEDQGSFYFVHSYYPQPSKKVTLLCETEYSVVFPSGFARGNVAAFQFHPEKSGRGGLKILENFLTWNP